MIPAPPTDKIRGPRGASVATTERVGMGDQPQKIKVQCLCGKRYKVAAEKAGSEMKCGECGNAVFIPRPASVTGRTRKLILQELGIDADSAEKKYKDEVDREAAATSGNRVYTCTKCEGKIKASELKGCYVKGELVCKPCQDSALVEDRRLTAEAEAAAGSKDKRRKRVVKGGQKGSAFQSAKYGLLVFFGFGGPIWAVGLGLLPALAVGLVLGGAVAFFVHRREIA